MGRIVFFIALAVALYLAWRFLLAPKVRRALAAEKRSTVRPEAMVSCAACGLHLPRPDAIADGERYFCCEEHRVRAPSS